MPPRTIRLMGQVNKKPVNILFDIGFIHNFMDHRVVQRTGLLVTPEQAFKVTVAGGDKLQSEGLCKGVRIKSHGVEIVVDFHILPIGGCQMVLVVDWLQTLDELTLSLKNQRVKMSKGRKTWEFNGIQPHAWELVIAGTYAG